MADYQPWYTGDTYPSWDIPLNAGGVADNISSVDITKFVMIFRNAQGVDTTGTGTFSIKTTNPAEIYYKPSTSDVASAFTGTLIVKTSFPPSNGAADTAYYDPISFTITQS